MAEKTLEIGIIGLGKFGLRMATTLASLGHTVIGIDMSDARVQLAEEQLDTVYKADATSLSVLRSLHVQDLDWVVISVGEGVEQSLSITLNIQELGGPKIWVKASISGTMVDLNLIQSFGVMVMGIRPAGERVFQFVPPALTVLHKGDTLVVAGRADAVRKLEP